MSNIKKEQDCFQKIHSIEKEEDATDDIFRKLGIDGNEDDFAITNFSADLEFLKSMEEQFKNTNSDDDSDDVFHKLGMDNENDNNLAMSNKFESSDSVGEKLNAKINFNHPSDLEFLTSFEENEADEYCFGDDDETCSFNSKFSSQSLYQAKNEKKIGKEKRFKNGSRASFTFSNERVKEIDRENQILFGKIIRSGPSIGDGNLTKMQGFSFNKQRPVIKSASEISRQKKQQQTEYENRILQRKLDKISSRRRSM